MAPDLDVGVHLQRHFGRSQQQGFVVEHTAHVAVYADEGLVAAPDVFREALGNADDAEDLAAAQQLFGLGDRRAVRRDGNVGRGVHHADERTALRRAAVIDDRGRHLAHDLVGIDPRVEERIGQRHEEDEDQDALVPEQVGQLVVPDAENSADRFHGL